MKRITEQKFEEERALYGESDLTLLSCSFEGEADGESALKEASNIDVVNTTFKLRYPFWHCKRVDILDSYMSEGCRAALWYSDDVKISRTRMHGIKALRECKRVVISDSEIISPEFGWFSSDIKMTDTEATSEYFMLRAERLDFSDVKFRGKYSFQYITDSTFDNCNFDTKDAFWHAKNVTVRNSVVKGEYLAWYSENLTFENCLIIGTQPLCYCKNLRLINCRTEGCDLSFEKSSVYAEIDGPVDSIKNPESGEIFAESAELILDAPTKCKIRLKNNRENTVCKA